MVAARRPVPLAEATPARLVPLINLLNSQPIGGRPDAFESAAAAEAYLAQCGFDGGEVPVGAAGLRQLRALRAALIGVIERPDDDDAWAAIDEIASRAKLQIRVAAPGRTELRSTAAGVQAVVDQTIAILHAALADGTWTRVRLCALDACHSAFYDATRSRTQRWHSYATCGNRTNVAAYRAAHRS